VEDLRHQVRDLDVVQVGKREVCVAADADLRQMNDPDVAAVAVHDVPPQPRHHEARTPPVLPRVRDLLRRNVVAVVA